MPHPHLPPALGAVLLARAEIAVLDFHASALEGEDLRAALTGAASARAPSPSRDTWDTPAAGGARRGLSQTLDDPSGSSSPH